MKSLISALLFLSALPGLCGSEAHLRRIGEGFRPGAAGAVLIERGSLVHTALMLPMDGEGRLISQEADGQVVAVLRGIERILLAAGTDLDHLVRLHVYVTDPAAARTVEAVLARRFRAPRQPAVTFVETAMPRAGIQVMMDAIAATGVKVSPGEWKAVVVDDLPRLHPRASHGSMQPEGPWVVVSGRAAPGEFRQGIRDTMERLRSDLAGVGLGFEDVVQMKTFLRDMPRKEEAEEIIAGFFGGERVPPQVFTEWMQTTIPAEIELIAVGKPSAEASDPLGFVEPMTRFSRVARVHRGRPVFISGLSGRSEEPRQQVREIFAELRTLLEASGSDFHHLVKATYYVSDNEADAEINAIRPTLYDPNRAPAASKLSVRGTGRRGTGSTIDMIAVSVE